MGWKMRKGVPSDSALKAYDDRMAAQESGIRRPGRKIYTISNEEYDRRLAVQNEARRKDEELQMLWQSKHLDAIKQRNDLIRHKLFLLFKDNFDIDTSNADTVSKQPLARAIAAVCNSITKDSVSYTYITALSKHEQVPWQAGSLRDYVQDSLGNSIDCDDISSVREAVEKKKTLLELISSQVERDLDDVTAGLKLQQDLHLIPNYSDPKVAENLKSVVFRCLIRTDFPTLQANGTKSEKDDIEKQYVAAAHKALDEATIYHGLAGIMKDLPPRLRLDTEQLKALKSALNTKVSIRAFYDFCGDTEWSKNVEGLMEEKRVLESLVGPDSDAVLRTIDETIADTYLANNRLVEESAKIRNDVFTFIKEKEDTRESMESTHDKRARLRKALSDRNTNIENFEKACQEESVKFRDMENDTAYKKLFPGNKRSEEDDYRNVRMFTLSGYI